MFFKPDINYKALVNSLGGVRMLRLMIDAKDLRAHYADGTGLDFTFGEDGRTVQLIPHPGRPAVGPPVGRPRAGADPGASNDSYYTSVLVYQIGMSLQGAPYIMSSSPENLIRDFEQTAKVALSFS
jgi:hypothetical protein